MTDAMWLEASRDVEAENAELVMSKAKMATANIWPFLALANSTNEFEHRLALAEDHLESAVPHVGTRDQIIASFREDFGIVDSIRAEAADDGDDDDQGGESDGDGDDMLGSQKNAVTQFFHEASRQWITVESAAEPTPGNPYNVPVEEAGPATAQTGDYPKHPTGQDPWNPLNEQFPMQPSQWQDSVQWVDNPMSFAPYRTASAPYTNEGVQTGTGPNPDYFAGGEEGVAGSQQAGFPVDESIPEPDERVDYYGQVPPAQSGGSTGDGGTYGKEAVKDNHGACHTCKQPVYREGSNWKHLRPDDGHHVMLTKDHPWVQQRLSAHREPFQKHDKVYLTQDTHDEEFGDGEGFHAPKGWTGSVNHVTDPGVDKNGDTWVALNQPSKSRRRDYFYAPVEHVRRQSQRKQSAHGSRARFFDPVDASVGMARVADASSTDMGAGQTSAPGGDAAPPAPPSMSQGGPGSEAMPPMNQPQTIPNQSVSQHPFPNLPAGGAGGGGGGAAPGGMGQNPFMGGNPFMGSFTTVADQTRDRPDMFNPTGVGDEYTDRTWEGQVNQAPRQNPEDRNVNTPQRATPQIPQNSSNGGPRDDEEEEGGDRR